MSESINYDEWLHLGPNDPPPDLSREEATYERAKEWLLRDHLGKVVVIHKDDIVGVFDTPDEAIYEGICRRGRVRLVFRLIEDDDSREPDFVSMVDVYHPSVKLLDNRKDANGQIHGRGA